MMEAIFLALLISTGHTQDPTALTPKVMWDISYCESRLRQFDTNGSVLKSKTSDYGLFQINKLHIQEAKKLGFDIMTPEGNIGYALYLYRTQGTAPWSASSHCWNKAAHDG